MHAAILVFDFVVGQPLRRARNVRKESGYAKFAK